MVATACCAKPSDRRFADLRQHRRGSGHCVLRASLKCGRRIGDARAFPSQHAGSVPVVVLGRLAIDRAYQGHGLGRAMFQDAGRRVIQAADAVGIRGLLVHALSEEAKAFYLGLGLDQSPLEPMTLMVTLQDLRAARSV
jgi:GNAT superfamily N-acetyltransferase